MKGASQMPYTLTQVASTGAGAGTTGATTGLRVYTSRAFDPPAKKAESVSCERAGLGAGAKEGKTNRRIDP